MGNIDMVEEFARDRRKGERICCWKGCGTILSRYNKNRFCMTHLRKIRLMQDKEREKALKENDLQLLKAKKKKKGKEKRKMVAHRLEGIAKTKEVFLDGEKLNPEESQKIRNHSPDGFNWGYGGSGPAQLALAVMLKLTGKADGYQEFKWDVIAKLPAGEDFEIEFKLLDGGRALFIA